MKPSKETLSEEEQLRDNHALKILTEAKSGHSIESVAYKIRCSPFLAGESIRRLVAKGDIEQYEGACHVKLFRLKTGGNLFAWGLR